VSAPKLKHRLIAVFSALGALFIFLLGPMFLYRKFAGIPLDAPGPEWEIWLLVLGGGLGAGAGRAIHNYFLVHRFGYSITAEEEAWRG